MLVAPRIARGMRGDPETQAVPQMWETACVSGSPRIPAPACRPAPDQPAQSGDPRDSRPVYQTGVTCQCIAMYFTSCARLKPAWLTIGAMMLRRIR